MRHNGNTTPGGLEYCLSSQSQMRIQMVTVPSLHTQLYTLATCISNKPAINARLSMISWLAYSPGQLRTQNNTLLNNFSLILKE